MSSYKKRTNDGPEEIPTDSGPTPSSRFAHVEQLSKNNKQRYKKKKSTEHSLMIAPVTRPEDELAMENWERVFPGAVAVTGDELQPSSTSSAVSEVVDYENPSHENEQLTRRTETVEELAIAAYVSDEAGPPSMSEPSTSKIVVGEPMSKRSKWFIMISILLAILVGAVIAIAVALTQQNKTGNTTSVEKPLSPASFPTATTPPAASPVINGPSLTDTPSTTTTSSSTTISTADASSAFVNSIQLQEYTLIEAGGYKVAASDALVTSESDCLAYCAEYDALRFSSFVSDASCVCYSAVQGIAQCATPWGDQVNTMSYIAFGTILSKEPFTTCSVDYCTAQPNDGVCFTANTLSLQDYTLIEAGGYTVAASDALVTSESDCLTHCAEYDSLRFSSFASDAGCICYSAVQGTAQCATPWGDQVNTISYIAVGTIFSKVPFTTCSVDFCGTNINNYLCLTGNEAGASAFIVDSAVQENQVTSTVACLQNCANFSAAEYSSYTSVCRCYDTPECLAVDSNGQSVLGRMLFTKEATGACSDSLCVLAPTNELC